MSTRSLAVAALAALGVWYLGVAVAALASAIAADGFDQLGQTVVLMIPTAALGLGLLLARRVLGRRISDEVSPEPGAGASQLQLVGITLIGVYLAACGLESFLDGTLQTVLASEHDEYFQKTTYLRRNADAIATTVVGFVVLTTSRQLHGWLVRERVR